MGCFNIEMLTSLLIQVDFKASMQLADSLSHIFQRKVSDANFIVDELSNIYVGFGPKN